MTAQPLQISVVTASMNQGTLLRDAIESVLAQNYRPFEHIIIDNCSSDETKSIVGEYPHLTFISEPDHGQSDALNKGFRRAGGDIIGWLNADEFYLPNTFQCIAQTFARDQKVDVVYGDAMHWFVERNSIGRRRAFRFSINMLRYWGTYFNTSSTFFSRRFIDEGELVDEAYHYHMDHEFLLRLAEQGYRFRYVPELLSVFRVHEGAKTSSARTVDLRNRERSMILDRYAGKLIPRSVRPFALKMLEWMYTASYGATRKLSLQSTSTCADDWLRAHVPHLRVGNIKAIPHDSAQ